MHDAFARYTVEKLNYDEEKAIGEFGWKLVHADESKRTWFIQANDAKEQTEWMQVLSLVLCTRCALTCA
jgi:hypothetical protein